jgi:CheY-like chemotaxis protein
MTLPGQGADGSLGELVVLIAEDDPAVATVLAMVVEDAGYVPVVASDGARALALARDRLPALLITDLMMPVLDGCGLIAALRCDGASLPSIVVTAVPSRAAVAGADAVLAKPFHIGQLEALLARLLPA